MRVRGLVGPVVLSACSHAGIVNVMKAAQAAAGGAAPYAVIGGERGGEGGWVGGLDGVGRMGQMGAVPYAVMGLGLSKRRREGRRAGGREAGPGTRVCRSQASTQGTASLACTCSATN